MTRADRLIAFSLKLAAEVAEMAPAGIEFWAPTGKRPTKAGKRRHRGSRSYGPAAFVPVRPYGSEGRGLDATSQAGRHPRLHGGRIEGMGQESRGSCGRGADGVHASRAEAPCPVMSFDAHPPTGTHTEHGGSER